MASLKLKKRRRPGISPGTLDGFSHTDRTKEAPIHLIQYSAQEFFESDIDDVAHMTCPAVTHDGVYWYNIDGVNHPEQLSKIGYMYQLHPLLVEDIASADQRAKMDDYENHVFLSLKTISFEPKHHVLTSEQISIVFGKGYVLTFQELNKSGDVFDPNRERLKQNKGRMRRMGSDYLVYSFLDTVVDNYFLVMEKMGERLEIIEQEMLVSPTAQHLKDLYKIRRELIYMRKAIWPLREVISKLQRDECSLISAEVSVYLRDVYDHTIQVIETLESFRDILSGIVDVYLSSLSIRMNNVMKVLTVISTIFMPLSFIVGLYGMNFKYMPELESPYGYPLVVTTCVALAGSMLYYFKRRGWLN
ncbi:MAG: magnesium/cobalt transporter CorA [Cytophagaceae bacterium]|jgi:magnesium transporter|nr:magnesium/cobalt transporter CorA [Cytophagaceae bacterium]